MQRIDCYECKVDLNDYFTDEGLGSSSKHFGSGSLGSGSAGSVYLSDSQDWVVSPSCSPDEAPVQHSGLSPILAEETFRYMSKSNSSSDKPILYCLCFIYPSVSLSDWLWEMVHLSALNTTD